MYRNPLSVLFFSIAVLSWASCARGDYTLYADVPYDSIPGVDPNLLSLDIYVPDGADGTNPVMVMYHGGSFISGDKTVDGVAHPKMDYYTDRGWVFRSVNYRLTNIDLPFDHPDQVSHPDHIIDAASSIAWIVENIGVYGGNPDRIVLMGFSAGAQLVVLVGSDETRLATHGLALRDTDGVIELDGMYDIPLRYEQVPPPPPHMSLVWGFDLPSRVDMSPRLHVTPNGCIPPMFIVHLDAPNNTEQSTVFAAALTAAGYDAGLYNAVGKSHSEIGGDVGIENNPLTILVDDFLAALGSNSG